jgi:hypothetical protein
MNLDNIGVSTVKDSTAFKKIQFFSKTNPTNLFNIKSDFENSFNKLNTYYRTDLDLNESYTYGMDRQHNYTSLSSTLPMFSTLLDQGSVTKCIDYNFNTNPSNKTLLGSNRLNYDSVQKSDSSLENIISNYNKLLPLKLTSLNQFDFSTFLNLPNVFAVLGAENDSKQYSNPFKYSLNLKHKKKLVSNIETLVDNTKLDTNSLSTINTQNHFNNSTYNNENTLKFKDYKSSNAQFLGSERTPRLLNNLNSNTFKWNTSGSTNTVNSISNQISGYGGSQNSVYSAALSNWSDLDKHSRFANNMV